MARAATHARAPQPTPCSPHVGSCRYRSIRIKESHESLGSWLTRHGITVSARIWISHACHTRVPRGSQPTAPTRLPGPHQPVLYLAATIR